MTKDQCIQFFGSRANLARAIGVALPSISEWKEFPPPLRQVQIQRLSGGALVAEKTIFDTKRGRA